MRTNFLPSVRWAAIVWALVWCAVAPPSAPLVRGEGAPPAPPAPTDDPQPGERPRGASQFDRSAGEANALRMREGTQLTNQLGRFRAKSDMATFITSDGIELGGLPNLNLQRILRMLKSVEEPESVLWSVSGTVTEFGERNFLLISRATFKSTAPPPAPEAIDAVEASPATVN